MAYKILVADDELTLLSTLRAYLEGSGFEVVTATNGRDALFATPH
jgi:CheY-like chemotaxis protein